ncbi:unnamed protein product [Rotaria sp. Silwood1]|nr:unnamed protein product [Rotaria sp. Silwood1]CAF1646785.1 unnamed protein product [Rotaria sp. Silwood1]
MYMSQQLNNTVAPFLTDQDLNKMFHYIFELYDYDASGKLAFEDYIIRERGQQVFNYLNKYNNLSYLNKMKSDDNSSSILNNNFQDHWNKVDIDGTGRVSKDKFIDYISKIK